MEDWGQWCCSPHRYTISGRVTQVKNYPNIEDTIPIVSAMIITGTQPTSAIPVTNSSATLTTTNDIINQINPSVKNLTGRVMSLSAPPTTRFTSPSMNTNTKREDIPSVRLTPDR
jgi:hypothetical protein